jgi:hypothetical protein
MPTTRRALLAAPALLPFARGRRIGARTASSP